MSNCNGTVSNCRVFASLEPREAQITMSIIKEFFTTTAFISIAALIKGKCFRPWWRHVVNKGRIWFTLFAALKFHYKWILQKLYAHNTNIFCILHLFNWPSFLQLFSVVPITASFQMFLVIVVIFCIAYYTHVSVIFN